MRRLFCAMRTRAGPIGTGDASVPQAGKALAAAVRRVDPRQ